MRDYLFRGKSRFDNRWVYGLPRIRDEHDAYSAMIEDRNGLGSDIFPLTLSQSISVVDKTGKEIFEGDIVECFDRGRKCVFEVKYRSDGDPGFILYPNYYLGEMWYISGPKDTSLEVIGNIHDNPTLLQEKRSDWKPVR